MKLIAVLLALAVSASATDFPLGAVTEFTVTLSLEQRRAIGRGQTSRTDRALCAIGLPAHFDPARPGSILVVSSTSDPGYNSSRAWLRERYAPAALAAGWIVIAADPPTPQPPTVDSPELRYGLVRAALDHLARIWPGSADWPLVCAGFSGGSKHSVHIAAQAARDGRNVIGLFLGGCNEDVSYTAFNLYAPPRRAFRRVPVFISGGEGDRIATPDAQAQVEASLRSNGFTRVRRESYPGVHEFHEPHLVAALEWFADLQRPVGALPW
ncbi:MAG TPA: hypothetical protein VEB66_10690 [Opitutaceae bacterium]|nr:hypothetical protein [Opitutaceae bacterium]